MPKSNDYHHVHDLCSIQKPCLVHTHFHPCSVHGAPADPGLDVAVQGSTAQLLLRTSSGDGLKMDRHGGYGGFYIFLYIFIFIYIYIFRVDSIPMEE